MTTGSGIGADNRLGLFIAVAMSFCSPVYAADAPNGGCNYEANPPCDRLLAGGQDTTDGGHAMGFCKQMEANDSVCKATWPIATGYSVMAVFCGAVCATSWIGPWGYPACTVGSLAAAGADVAAGLLVDNKWQQYSKDAPFAMSQAWGLTPRIGAPAIQGGIAVWQAVASVGAGSSARIAGQAAAEDATALKGAQDGIAQNSAGKMNDWDATMKIADYKAAEENKAEAAKKAADAKDANETAKKVGACISMAVNGIMAGIKWYDFANIISSSGDNYNDLCGTQGIAALGGCSNTPQPSSSPNILGAPNLPPAGSLAGVGSPPSLPPVRGTKDLKGPVNAGFGNGSIGSSMATAAPEKGLPPLPSADTLNKAAKALYDKTGLTPGDIAQGIATQGLAGTMGGLLGGNEKAAQILKQLDAEAKRLGQSGGAFESIAGGSSRGGGKGGGSPFSFGGSRDPAAASGGVGSVSFGGFEGDIWHAGSTKSIFEIVSDRTHAVANRIQ